MILNAFYKGEARSPYDGFESMDNLDVHSRIGTAKCQLALVSESTVPNEACVQAESVNGDVYFFSTESGKTWKRSSLGVYSLINTNANGAHRGAKYYNGKIYYWTHDDVGHYDLSSTWTDSAHVLSNGDARGGEVVNDVLFIGDGNYIAAITTSGTFTANSLDINTGFSATDLIGWNARLLIGTDMGSYVSHSKVFLWDTYSSTYTTDDDVFEQSVNTFVRLDNLVAAHCGTAGSMYYWNGTQMVLFKNILGVTVTPSSTSHALKNTYNGKPLLGIGTDVYSIHRSDKDLTYALVHEYTVTSGAVKSVGVSGDNLLISNGNGIDNIGTNYAIAKIVTPIVKEKDIEGIYKVSYESIPTGCSLSLETNVNGAGWVSETGFKKDSDNMEYWLEGGVTYSGNIKFIQLRLTITPATTNTPIIQDIKI